MKPYEIFESFEILWKFWYINFFFCKIVKFWTFKKKNCKILKFLHFWKWNLVSGWTTLKHRIDNRHKPEYTSYEVYSLWGRVEKMLFRPISEKQNSLSFNKDNYSNQNNSPVPTLNYEINDRVGWPVSTFHNYWSIHSCQKVVVGGNKGGI